MTTREVAAQIEHILRRMLRERGEEPPALTEATQLVGETDLAIDSLDLAALVTELEEITGKDPFKDGFVEFRTLGELARLYGDPE